MNLKSSPFLTNYLSHRSLNILFPLDLLQFPVIKIEALLVDIKDVLSTFGLQPFSTKTIMPIGFQKVIVFYRLSASFLGENYHHHIPLSYYCIKSLISIAVEEDIMH